MGSIELKLKDFQTSRYINFGFVHYKYELTNFGEYVWKAIDTNTGKTIFIIVDYYHKVLRIVQ